MPRSVMPVGDFRAYLGRMAAGTVSRTLGDAIRSCAALNMRPSVNGTSDVRRWDRERRCAMRPLLLWVIGIPIPIIILLYVFHVI